MSKEMTVEQIELEWKKCTELKNSITKDIVRVEAELELRQRTLKQCIAECVNAGFDPSTIVDDIKRAKEVAILKIENYKNDLNSAREIIDPMLSEISK